MALPRIAEGVIAIASGVHRLALIEEYRLLSSWGTHDDWTRRRLTKLEEQLWPHNTPQRDHDKLAASRMT